ncbi:hypothetical protein DICVIV_07451 [Dictyocaulus viviparus]|uniref:Uncharacterized protein n=1 Tax=Dictyocaulus viviparus TaxID=29172 RepID=A0A0D8XRS6_DICVI|nr:hypothetical protein DICVIV_07451 [Dictyocaulus viviparus]
MYFIRHYTDSLIYGQIHRPLISTRTRISSAAQDRTTTKAESKESSRLLWRDIYAEALTKKTFCELNTRPDNETKVISDQAYLYLSCYIDHE